MGLFTSCGTKKNTWVNRNYHNLNARFNGYFNGNLALDEAVTAMENAYVDDYSKVLPIYTYGSPKDAKTAIPAMEKVFKKASFVINRHSMLIKGQEHCSWIDDTYLLIGKSHFYKHDYFAGVEVFEYIISQYKKEPTKYEALLWLIKTYNEIGAFSKSQGYIDLIKSDGAFPYRFNGELMAVTADFYSKQENYEQAAKFLNRAISYSKKKRHKARYTFILAQMYQRLKKFDLSRNAYGRVVKLNPKYELSFYAKINQAKMYDANSGDSRQIVNQLNKMLKDFKNTDYYDQIYYALAEIEIKEGNAKRAEDFLLKSIKASTTNRQQKGISSLKLADLYFEIPKYPMAGAYYDSAVTFLDEKFEGYDIVLNKKKSLDRLIFDYNTIATEDSLQRMAKLSDKDLDKLVTAMIQKAKEEEERKKEAAEEQALNGAAAAPGGASNQKDQGSGSSWYFYNQQQITFGFSEFQKKWGARKLEDNWRRSNKQIIASFVPDTDSDSLSGKKATAAIDTTGPANSKQWYLKNLPVGKEKMDASVLKVVEAYYDLGIIYKEQLLNLEKAAASFENLNEKIPGNKYEATCYYQLYRLYLTMKDMAMAEKYKNIILTKFPDSDYAAILKNPQFNLERKNRMNKIESFYEETYTAYTNGNYAIALERCNAADTLIAQSPFKPKFSLLKALTIGHLKPLADFEISLKQVVADYPKDSVKIRAEEILIVIQKLKFGDTPLAANDTSAAKKSNYKVGPDKSHLFVLAFETKDVNTQQITSAVADFNVEYYETKEYQTNYIPFGSSKGLVVVKPIKNGTEAIDYFGTIQSADNIFSTLPAGKYTYFIISDENYIVLFKEQNTDGYLAFFTQNYKMEKE